MSDQCNVMGCAAAEERGYAGMTGTMSDNHGQMSNLDAKKRGEKVSGEGGRIEKRHHVTTHWNFSSYSGCVAFGSPTFQNRFPPHLTT